MLAGAFLWPQTAMATPGGGFYTVKYYVGSTKFTDTIYVGLSADGRTALGTSNEGAGMEGAFSDNSIWVHEVGGGHVYQDSYYLVFDDLGSPLWAKHGGAFVSGGRVSGVTHREGGGVVTETHDVISFTRLDVEDAPIEDTDDAKIEASQ